MGVQALPHGTGNELQGPTTLATTPLVNILIGRYVLYRSEIIIGAMYLPLFHL